MDILADDELMHIGMAGRSGRYPHGYGENPHQHCADFLGRIDKLKSEGLTETEIARAMGLSTTQYRAQKALAKDQERSLNVDRAKSLAADGLGATEIGRQMGVSESTVRSWLNPDSEIRMNQATTTAKILKDAVDEKGVIDIGKHANLDLGVSPEKMKQAVEILKSEGYETRGGRVPQATNPGKFTTMNVLVPPGAPKDELFRALKEGRIHSIKEYDQILTEDGTKIRKAFEYPSSLDSSRMKIRYAEEGGLERDGMIEIRRGVEDLSLGNSHYAQVRIMVDGTHYMKGMAVYSDNLPKGVDIVFNTNKTKGTPQEKVLKPIKDDPDNPFGSLIKEHGGQSYYDDPKGKYTDPVTGKKQSLSLINKRAEEGDWGEWSNTLSSQFLSKQSLQLVKKQLGLAAADKQAEYEEICSLTNPTVKKYMLNSFADDCDSAAVHLKAASLPRQKYQVIMPIPSLKENEVYAPNYKDGETVALVRYPHGGTFEIPILKVNNKHAESRKLLSSNPEDVVGINHKVAEQLSGADFDGDTVMVIPCNSSRSKVKIESKKPLDGLKDFDPKMEYGTTEKNGDYYNASGQKIKVMTNTGTEMGKISNLITDMTLLGAGEDDIAKAVRHSMVVIDAEKHKLDYKQSEKDNQISLLKKKWQISYDDEGNEKYGGTSTIVSRAKSQTSVPKTQGSGVIDPDTGKKTYKTADDLYYTDPKTGQQKMRMQKSTKMAETDDAHTLVSAARNPKELEYANYANKMKALANQARKEMMATGKIEYSSTASKTYQQEVNSLMAKLDLAKRNAPKERRAQALAYSVVEAKKKAHPDMTKSEIKKENQRALTAARIQVGAKRNPIDITDREWEAIQAGAISENRLTQILGSTDIDAVRQRATPRTTTALSTAQIARIKNMAVSGNYSNADIAAQMGVSTSTISRYLAA